MGSWWMMLSLRWLAYLSTLHPKPVSPALQSWNYHLTPSNPPEGKHRDPTWTCCPVSQLKPAAHVTDQQTSFWKAEFERQCNEDFLIQVPLWFANQDTFTLAFLFILLLQKDIISTHSKTRSSKTRFPDNIHYYGLYCLTGQIWLKCPKILWKDEVPPHYWIHYQIYWSP